MRRLRGQGGQSTVEIVAMLPVLALAGLAILQALAAGAAQEYAGHAAEAGAVAIAQKRDPAKAARAALPGWSQRRITVTVRSRRVTVSVRPPALLAPVARLLEARASATPGPAPG